MYNWDEFIEKLKDCEIKSGYAVVILTDEVRVSKYNGEIALSSEEYINKLLDMRVFDNDCELHIFRSDVGRKFNCRILKNDGTDMYEDYQILEDNNWEALVGKEKIKLVNHIRCDESGQAYIYDWRLADFVGRSE